MIPTSNGLFGAIICPGHVLLSVKHPVAVTMLAHPDQQITQLIQGGTLSTLSEFAFRDLFPQLKQMPAANRWVAPRAGA
jgi:hypothetical protein